MSKTKVLIVDDEPGVREFVGEVLSTRYQIIFAKSGAESIEIARTQNPTIIILDVLMPGMNGLQTCEELRKDERTREIPILMLTALNETSQRTLAFELGADDYIVKPFVPEELLARVESKIRRIASKKPAEELVRLGELTLNFKALNADVSGREIDIGPIEFKILNCLIRHHGVLVDRQTLNTFVWGSETPSDRALDPHITALRKKLKDSGIELKTVYGRGYSLLVREKAA